MLLQILPMKKIRIFAFLLSALCLFLPSCQAEENGNSSLPFTTDAGEFVETGEESNFVCIEMDTGKKMIVELYPDVAPITVANFKKLVSQKFYDQVKFHRVEKNFVIQGGDPEGTGRGGPGWSIKGEFSANGVENGLLHEKGVLSMARSQEYDSAGSQFFICLSRDQCKHLDGSYAAFGRVIAGMDVVDEIASVKVAGSTPVYPQVMQRVYFVTKTEN